MRSGFVSAVGLMLIVSGCQTTNPDGAIPATQSDRLVNLAREIEAQGEEETALALYARAAAAPDASVSAKVMAGEAYLRMGYTDEAIATYKVALAESPENGDVLLGLGAAQVQTGDLNAGIRALATAAPIVGTSRAYNRLGVAQTMAGNTEAAKAAFEQALQLEPGDIDVLSNLALAAALEGNGALADKALQRVIASNREQLFHKRNYVLVYGLLGRDELLNAPAGLSSDEVSQILAEARRIRTRGSLTARAAALGNLQV